MSNNQIGVTIFGSGSQCQNESAEIIEMKVPKYSARGPKNRGPKRLALFPSALWFRHSGPAHYFRYAVQNAFFWKLF